MASLRSNIVVVMVVAAAMLLTVSGDICPSGLVYPYWSTCFAPARFYGDEVYQLADATYSTSGNLLAPEYDEANSTYYMRLAEEGATYKLVHITFDYRSAVALSHDVIFVNVDTGRALGWREEGEDELFLVEQEFEGSRFQFSAVEDLPLPCPRIFTARCEAYYIVDFTTSSLGLSPYEEDGVTYFKQASDKGIPFLLLRSSSTKSLSANKSQVLASPA